MKVIFENKFGMEREIGEGNTKREVYKVVADFLKSYNYKSYYTRSWIKNTERDDLFYVMLDVGSHSEFFKIPFSTYMEAEGFLKESQ